MRHQDTGLARTLWRYRRHVWHLTTQDLRTRYAGSAGGLLWAFIHPVSILLIYTLVFSRLMSGHVPDVAGQNSLSFALYLCSGLFPWSAFSEAIQRGSGAFVDHAPLLKKLYFPEPVFVAKVVCASAVHLAIAVAIILLLLIASGVYPTGAWCALPMLMAAQLLLAFALALLGATLHVFFRDVAQVVAISLQAWFWLTPIVYVPNLLPDWAQNALWLNPAYHLIEAYHQILLLGRWPAIVHWAALAGSTALLLASAQTLFIRLRSDVRDEI